MPAFSRHFLFPQLFLPITLHSSFFQEWLLFFCRMETWLSTALARTVITYLAQAVLGLILFLIFKHFYKIYNHRFLNTWAISWLSFGVFMISTAAVTGMGINQPFGIGRISLTVISMISSYAQAALILVGSLELIRSKAISRKHLIILISAIIVASVIMVLLRHDDPEGRTFRYVVRVGFKYFVVSIVFFVTAAITIKNNRFVGGIGQRTMTLGFISYALINFYYAFVVIYNVWIAEYDFPLFFGLIELLSICKIGLGMVMWLLEDERLQLKKANQELDSFLYSVSHDLRAPIASILGLTHLAKLETTDPKTSPYISMIEQRIKKLDSVIGDILQLSRSSKAELKIELVDFNNLMAEIISDVKFNQGADKIQLHYNSSPEHVFMCDRAQVRIILNNLVSNAIKYHRLNQDEPFVKVSFQKQDTMVVIAVSDNGEGIAPDNQDKIFEMFYRASSNSDGTGLGLYIVKEAVHKLNGKIEVESRLRVGSTFTITIPAQ